jgi:hypothetical protein
MDIETRLRQDLAARAQDIGSAPPHLVDDVIDGHRTQRRHQAALLAVAAAVVAVAVGVPLILQGSGAGQTATPTSSPTSAEPLPSGPVVPYQRFDLPPRGSLAGDPEYLQGLLDHPWSPSDPATDPPPEARQVVFAGEVPGGVQALVVGERDGDLVGLWLAGPAGSAPADLEASNEAGPVDLSLPVAFTHTQDGMGALVVIGRPGDRIEISTGQQVAADGSLTRLPYQAVGDPTGIAIVDATGLSTVTTAIRVTRAGQVLEVYAEGGSSGGNSYGLDLAEALAGATGDPDAQVVQSALDYSLMMLGLSFDEVEPRVLWGGAIGNSAQPDAVAAVLTVRLPTGAVLLLGQLGSDRSSAADGGGLSYSGPCGTALLPAGTDVAASGVAMVCELYDPQGQGTALGDQLVVVPPAGTADLEATDGAAVLQSYGFSGAALVVPAPDGVTSVTARDAAGEVLARIPLTGHQQLQAD